jgi:hypothetical protein
MKSAAIFWILVTGMALTVQAQAIDLDGQRIATGHFEYRTTLQVGDTIVDIDSSRHLIRDESGSLRIETVTRTGMGPTRDILELSAESLEPVRREVRQGDGDMVINYSADRVTGYIRAAGQMVSVDVELEQPAYAGESGLEALLAAMALTGGLETEIRVLEIDVATRIRHFQMTVGEAETVETPAGRYTAWPVHLKATDEFDDEQTIWISQSPPHVFLRAQAPVPDEMGGGALVTVLTAAEY